MFVILFAKVKKLLTEKLIYVIDYLCDAGRIQIPSYLTGNHNSTAVGREKAA